MGQTRRQRRSKCPSPYHSTLHHHTTSHKPPLQVVNAGDWLEVYSAGYYKATIHRVFQPPADQQTYNRLGLYYFGLPNDEVPLSPNLNAPVLKRTGVNEFYKREQFTPGPTMEKFRTGRVSTYGQVAVRKGAEEGTEEHVVTGGFVVKHYL